MFRFLHVADLHLDSPLKGLEQKEGAPVEQIRNATRRALVNMVDFALREGVNFVVIAGDLYDGDWRDAGTGLFFVRQMARLREADIPVVLIAGNHDAQNKMTQTLDLPKNVTYLRANKPETKFFDQWDVAVHGQSFASAKVEHDLSIAYPAAHRDRYNLGLLHTCGVGDANHARYAPCTLDGLRALRYDYWALGHIHQRQELCGQTPIVYSGNIQGRHPKETGPKGCLLVTVDGRASMRDFVALDVLRWEHCIVDATSAWSLDDVADEFRRQLQNLVAQSEGLPLAIRVTVTGASRAHGALASRGDAWRNDFRAIALDEGNDQVWLEKLILDTRPEQEPQELDGALGEIQQYLHELHQDPALLEALMKDFADLIPKLPQDMRERFTDSAEILRTLDVVEPLLHSRLEGKAAAR